MNGMCYILRGVLEIWSGFSFLQLNWIDIDAHRGFEGMRCISQQPTIIDAPAKPHRLDCGWNRCYITDSVKSALTDAIVV